MFCSRAIRLVPGVAEPFAGPSKHVMVRMEKAAARAVRVAEEPDIVMPMKKSSPAVAIDLGPIGRYTDYLQAQLQSRTFGSKGERTRFRLKIAAAKALQEGGFQDLKVADICLRAHVALGTFYVYFPDKSVIATEVLLDFGDALYSQAQRIAHGSSDFEAILLTNQFFVAAYQRNAGLVRCLIQLEDQIPEFRTRWRERRLHWLARIARSIARRAGHPEIADSMGMQIAYALEGLVFQYLYDVFVRQEPILKRNAGSSQQIAELLSVLWYRAVYCENPPAEQIAHVKAALDLRRARLPARRTRLAAARAR
jgi:AcrR family transcriptional regulator